jgi:tRNA dimethylallyltransferase
MKMPVILGPTASGKTHLAVQLALEIGSEIISADSRQVYRGLDIGTGKDLEEYTVDGNQVRYHLIDICDVGDEYEIARYFRDYCTVAEDIVSRNITPILCGGSGLYIETALRGNALAQIPVDLKMRETLEPLTTGELENKYQSIGDADKAPDTRKRLIRAIEIATYLDDNPMPTVSLPAVEPVLFGVDIPRDLRRQRITDRLNHRLENGMVEEVEDLLQRGVNPSQLNRLGLEYLFLTDYVQGDIEKEEMIKKLETAIHRFAKRQMTFFRKMEKDGWQITWLAHDAALDENLARIKAAL